PQDAWSSFPRSNGRLQRPKVRAVPAEARQSGAEHEHKELSAPGDAGAGHNRLRAAASANVISTIFLSFTNLAMRPGSRVHARASRAPAPLSSCSGPAFARQPSHVSHGTMGPICAFTDSHRGIPRSIAAWRSVMHGSHSHAQVVPPASASSQIQTMRMFGLERGPAQQKARHVLRCKVLAAQVSPAQEPAVSLAPLLVDVVAHRDGVEPGPLLLPHAPLAAVAGLDALTDLAGDDAGLEVQPDLVLRLLNRLPGNPLGRSSRNWPPSDHGRRPFHCADTSSVCGSGIWSPMHVQPGRCLRANSSQYGPSANCSIRS